MGPYGDATDFEKRRARLEKYIFSPSLEDEFRAVFSQLSAHIQRKADKVGGSKQTLQIDIVKAFANLIPIKFLGHLLPLPLKSLDTPEGEYTHNHFYGVLMLIFGVLFLRLDPALSYIIRTAAQPLAVPVGDKLEAEISNVPGISLSFCKNDQHPHNEDSSDNLRKLGYEFIRKFLVTGVSVCQVAWVDIIPTTAAFVANQARMLSQVIDYYLGDGAEYWPLLQKLAASDEHAHDDVLLHYALEAIRLNGNYSVFKTVNRDIEVPGHSGPLKVGDKVVIKYSDLALNAELYPRPNDILVTRPLDSYHFVGYGPNQALASPVSRLVLVGMFRAVARLKNVRRAPGPQGVIKVVEDGDASGLNRYMDVFWKEFSPSPTSLKLHFDP
ncbi:hypothetical protein ACHAQA_003672 [Verticillium albo-atrum]